MICPLCKHSGKSFYKDHFFICRNCHAIYKNKTHYLNTPAEIKRYESHQNDVNDVRYQAFVSPVTAHVLSNFTPHHKGLDFGCGFAPVISKVLHDNGYPVCRFDPFFADNRALLNQTYDYIIICEVMEHFHHPDEEFKRLYSMLKPCGQMICMTHLYDDHIDFKGWYYKNDPTHVFIYQQETIKFIAETFGFTNARIDNRLIVLNR